MKEVNTKILVLGSSGLVGSSLKDSEYLNSNYIMHYSSRSDTDLSNIDEFVNLFNAVKPNIVINCAGKVGGIVANTQNKFDFLFENLKITMNFFEILKNYSNLKIINFGSSAIYPKDAKNPLKEDYLMSGELEPTNSAYSLSKIVSIELGRNLKQNNIDVINLIPTNLYGPYDNFDHTTSHVVPGLISKIHKAKMDEEEEYLVWGSGKPLRELLYAGDLVRAIEVVLKDKVRDFDVINIGSGSEISIKNLANLVKEVVGFKGKLKFDDSKPDGVTRKILDSSKIKSLNWEPTTTLQEGLETTYEWFLNNEN
jgi:GDP-L-fucose synthase